MLGTANEKHRRVMKVMFREVNDLHRGAPPWKQMVSCIGRRTVESSRYAQDKKRGIMPEMMDNTHLHCSRCDSEKSPSDQFKSADNQTYYLCSRCVEQEDKREMKFSSSWRRSRRPASKIAVAA